jgi:hypothetical protein
MKVNVDLETLRVAYDVVQLRYEKPTATTGGRAIAVLKKGSNCFVGISKCHSEDQFDRKKGRTIALGRALLAYDIYNGYALPRTKLANDEEQLCFHAYLETDDRDVIGVLFG